MGLINGLFGNNRKIPCCYLCEKEGHIREMELVEGSVFVDIRKWNKPWNPLRVVINVVIAGG